MHGVSPIELYLLTRKAALTVFSHCSDGFCSQFSTSSAFDDLEKSQQSLKYVSSRLTGSSNLNILGLRYRRVRSGSVTTVGFLARRSTTSTIFCISNRQSRRALLKPKMLASYGSIALDRKGSSSATHGPSPGREAVPSDFDNAPLALIRLSLLRRNSLLCFSSLAITSRTTPSCRLVNTRGACASSVVAHTSSMSHLLHSC